MDKLIKTRLVKYYNMCHPDFVNSKSFSKTVRQTSKHLKDNPKLTYFTIQSIVDELNIRRKSGNVIVTDAEAPVSEHDERLDKKLRKLNEALAACHKKINELEEMEVNFDDDVNSTFIMVERFKARASDIYEKICDLTGESRHANRIVHKPIKFSDTSFVEFNTAVQNFYNKTLKFPDFYDILNILKQCNTTFDYGLRQDDLKRIGKRNVQ